jgi:hypothetical protein
MRKVIIKRAIRQLGSLRTGEIADSHDDRILTSIGIASILLNSFRLTPVGLHANITLL